MIEKTGIGQRVREIRESEGLSRPEMAIRLGISKHQRLADVENDRQRPPTDLLSKIVEIFHVRPEWLFEGKLPMLKSESAQVFDGRLSAIKSSAIEVDRLGLTGDQGRLLMEILYYVEKGDGEGVRKSISKIAKINSDSPSPAEGFVMVPRYEVRASAGHGAMIHSEQIVDYLAFRSDWVRSVLGVAEKALALIEVHGDSMEPTLSNGDLILLDMRHGKVMDNSVYAIQHNGDLLVKRIQRKLNGSIVVKSDNPRYEPESLDPGDADQLHVIGRVVWSGRRM